MKKKLMAAAMTLAILASITASGTISASANSYQDGTLPNERKFGYNFQKQFSFRSGGR